MPCAPVAAEITRAYSSRDVVSAFTNCCVAGSPVIFCWKCSSALLSIGEPVSSRVLPGPFTYEFARSKFMPAVFSYASTIADCFCNADIADLLELKLAEFAACGLARVTERWGVSDLRIVQSRGCIQILYLRSAEWSFPRNERAGTGRYLVLRRQCSSGWRDLPCYGVRGFLLRFRRRVVIADNTLRMQRL